MSDYLINLMEAEIEGVDVNVNHNVALRPDMIKVSTRWSNYISSDLISKGMVEETEDNIEWLLDFYIPKVLQRIERWKSVHHIDDIDMQEVL